jgi:hypothetical protein
LQVAHTLRRSIALQRSARPASARAMRDYQALQLRQAVLDVRGARPSAALSGIARVLEEDPRHAKALRLHYKLEYSNALRFRPAQPARFVHTARSTLRYIDVQPTDRGVLGEYKDTCAQIRRDRPYPAWFKGRGHVFDPRREPDEGEVRSSRVRLQRQFLPTRGLLEASCKGALAEARAPQEVVRATHWDFVINRLDDILVDRSDHEGLRKLVLRHIDMLLSVFYYYCRVGSAAEADGATRLPQILPLTIQTAKLDDEALSEYAQLFGAPDALQEDATAVPTDRPNTLVRLRQCLQLALDCNVLSSDCSRAALGRLFLFSSREVDDIQSYTEQAAGGKQAAGHTEISDVDERNPHNGNNQLHVYEFIEWVVRLAHQKMRHGARGRKAIPTVTEQFEALLTGHILVHSCTHESTDAVGWLARAPAVLRAQTEHFGLVEQCFRFFAAGEKAFNKVACEGGHGEGGGEAGANAPAATYWRQRGLDQFDDTMNYNEVIKMFEESRLFDAVLTPIKVVQIYKKTTQNPNANVMTHKNNEKTEVSTPPAVADTHTRIAASGCTAHRASPSIGVKPRGF